MAGDLSDLTSATISPDAVHPDDVTDTAPLGVASFLLLDLLREAHAQARPA